MDERVQRRADQIAAQLYEDSSITADMDDEAAEIFLGWAERVGAKIAEATGELDDEAAEETAYTQLKALRRLGRAAGRLAGGNDPAARLAEVIEKAAVLFGEGYHPPAVETLGAFLAGLKDWGQTEIVQALLSLIEGEDHETQPPSED